jgi:hypothetical protein
VSDSLRDALEEICALGEKAAQKQKDRGVPTVPPFVPVEMIRNALAAHPVEPAPVVTDEAVDKALDVVMDDGHNGLDCRPERHLGDTVRAALEAAAPLLGLRPYLGVVHVQHADTEEYARIFNLGFAEAVEQYTDDAPRPLLDRQALNFALRRVSLIDKPPAQIDDDLADAVMELARPMPTQAQVEEAVTKAWAAPDASLTMIIAAVEALLRGDES